MCYHPVASACYQLTNGKQKIVFNAWQYLEQKQKINDLGLMYVGQDANGVPLYAKSVRQIFLPCGKCSQCRAQKKRMWSLRLQHELKFHDKASFITLTYDNDHLPPDLSLQPRDLQLFIKRLRKAFPAIKLRYFACGEYGSKYNRPHYHLILFGLDRNDFGLVQREIDEASQKSFISCPKLQKIWKLGFVSVGLVSSASISYVAGYVCKKANEKALNGRLPEFVRMSTHPGIGREFFDKYQNQIISQDCCNFSGMIVKPPRYYDKLISILNPLKFVQIKESRLSKAPLIDFTELARSEAFSAYLATKQGFRPL